MEEDLAAIQHIGQVSSSVVAQFENLLRESDIILRTLE